MRICLGAEERSIRSNKKQHMGCYLFVAETVKLESHHTLESCDGYADFALVPVLSSRR